MGCQPTGAYEWSFGERSCKGQQSNVQSKKELGLGPGHLTDYGQMNQDDVVSLQGEV
jgi:hypothetical protein